MGESPCLSPIFTKGDKFCHFQFASLAEESLQIRKGKNLLQKEQIFFFKR